MGALRCTPSPWHAQRGARWGATPPSLGALDACGGAARARSCGGGSGGARLVKSLLEHLAKLDRHVLHLLLLLRDLGVLAGQLLRAPERATH